MFFSKTSHLTFRTLNDKPDTTSGVSSTVHNDVPAIIELVKEFRSKAYVKDIQKVAPKLNEHAVRRAIVASLTNGLCFVYRKNNQITGYIFGIITESLWAENEKTLEEVGFYAQTPRASLLLLNRYFKEASLLKSKRDITHYTMSSICGYDYDYSKFGLRVFETKWVA